MSFDLKITEGDISIGPDGDLLKVKNTDKLIQDILKMVTTELGSNVFFPWYGSPISRSLVGSVMDMEFISSIATGQLTNSLETLQRLQQVQARSQRVTPSELLAAIQHVKIERNQADPRFFRIVIKVITRALTIAQTEFELRSL